MHYSRAKFISVGWDEVAFEPTSPFSRPFSVPAYYAIRSGMLAGEAILQSRESGINSSDLYRNAVSIHIFENLKWALRFSHFVFRFTKLAYQTLRQYPELGNLYLRVVEGDETYQSFVTRVKRRMEDLLKGRLSEKIRKAMARI